MLKNMKNKNATISPSLGFPTNLEMLEKIDTTEISDMNQKYSFQ